MVKADVLMQVWWLVGMKRIELSLYLMDQNG